MALTPKERKQRQLARDHEARRRLPDSTAPYQSLPFHVWAEDDPNDSEFIIPWELMGFEAPKFDNDKGPSEFSIHPFGNQADHDETFAGFDGSVGRAELMAEMLIEAGRALASSVNTFKKQELQKRFAALEQEDLSDPERRKKALSESAHIARLQDELAKKVRYTMPQWIIKGI